MFKKSLIRTVLASLVGLVAAVMVAPSAASAATNEWDTAVAGTPPSFASSECFSSTGVTVCFQSYGDIWWVKDTMADSASAVAEWENIVNNTTARRGDCVNSLGNGRWAKCNKNYAEGSIIFATARRYDASEEKWLINPPSSKTYFP